MEMRSAFFAAALALAVLFPLQSSAGILGAVVKGATDTVKVEVPKVVSNTTNTGGDSTSNNTQLLGGGGHSINTGNLGGLLGPNGNIGVELPDTSSLLGGDPGGPGNPTNPDDPACAGCGYSGHGGGRFVMPAGISAQLRMLIEILRNKVWLNYAEGNKLCLPMFGRAEVKGWIPKKDWDELAQIIPVFKDDIIALQQMLGKCRAAAQRQAMGGNVKRAIGVGVNDDGTPIVYFF
ncbi:MAG: hypothetical protein ABL879_12345 [Devosia sp.]